MLFLGTDNLEAFCKCLAFCNLDLHNCLVILNYFLYILDSVKVIFCSHQATILKLLVLAIQIKD